MNLDRRINLLEPTTTRNNSGQYVLTYAVNSEVYAALNYTRANEDNSGWQLYGYSVVRWTIRYNANILHNWRVEHNGEEYDIQGIIPDVRRTYMTLICKLRDNDQ